MDTSIMDTSITDKNDTKISDVQSENMHAISMSSTKSRRLLEHVRKRKWMSIMRWSVVVILIMIGIIILTTIIIKKKTHTIARTKRTTTTTTTVTTTTTAQIALISIDGSIKAVHNTSVGGNSLESTPGVNWGYPSTESPAQACDRNVSTKYLNFGWCIKENESAICGLNTGFYLELRQGALLVTGLRLCTGDDSPERDPLRVSLEGSNQSGTALTLGKSWTPIYKSNSGLETDPDRNDCGIVQSFSNSIRYKSYRFLVSAKRAWSNSVQYSELQLFN